MAKKHPFIKTIHFGSLKWWTNQLWKLILLTLFFSLCRLIFIFRNIDFTGHTFLEIVSTFYYGFRLDLSIAAYISSFLLLLSFLLVGNKTCALIYRIIFTTVAILLIIITIADAELYSYWGYKMDASVIKYLKTPKEAIASLSTFKLFLIIVVIILASSLAIFLVQKYLPRIKLVFNRLWQLNAILVLPLYFLLARGSVDVSGVNISTAYFSQKQELNHAAVSAHWNFITTLFAPENKRTIEWNDSLSSQLEKFVCDCNSFETILKTDKANLILIILESFSANLIDYEINNNNPVPNLKKIISESCFFPNCYATGNRSDKGLSAIFSGITAHPQGSIMQLPEKFTNIGHMVSHIRETGYKTKFYYGGNADFANFKGFLISNGFESIIEQSDFPYRMRTSKWGVQDNYLFDRLIKDIKQESEPFFYSAFTLSSHEPFEVPYKSDFTNNSTLGKYLNSVSFTDSVLGTFYEQLKNTNLWNNTLLVIVADHGHYLPINTTQYETAHYRIPLIFSGGALKPDYRNKTNYTNISQAEIPYSILRQFNIKAINMGSENNIFCEDYNVPVGFVFNFGYGIISPNHDTLVFDADANRMIKYVCKDTTLIKASNAWFRHKMQVYSKE